jgi:tyrosine-protein kinase Etk/Wzc
VARRTEEFINGRLEKINAELGSTEGALESYKRRNKMIDQKTNASTAFGNADSYSQKIAEANTQIALLNELESFMNSSSGRYQSIPSNVGVADETATSLISSYNQIVSQRNRLLQSASESSPSVTPLTAQLDDLEKSIRKAMSQSRRNMEIQRRSLSSQLGKYQGEVSESPEQERVLNQIGRQQEVKSGLYLMLLQKREENSISLASTADKGKLVDTPSIAGKVSPKNNMIMGSALLAGLGIPTLIFFLIYFFRYKIEGHDDVEKLTKLPIVADVAVASEEAKTKANIVVHENQNNTMEEIFRTMRTNIQFMLEGDEKVIMFTSSTSGEGKTFNASNLAVSFALLGKKVLLVGLDIRRPKLAQLFEINDHHHGITNLLVKDEFTWNDVSQQIIPSGVNNNLDLLMSGPVPPNPTELVSRKSLESIFELIRANYDYILVDTAPVGLVTDTLQISRVVDATVYVCRADFTPKEYFTMVNSLAEQKKLPKVCIVVNGIDLSKHKYGYYYGYGTYGKYGRYGKYGHYRNKGTNSYGSYGSYGTYGSYSYSHYSDKNDNSVKRK